MDEVSLDQNEDGRNADSEKGPVLIQAPQSAEITAKGIFCKMNSKVP